MVWERWAVVAVALLPLGALAEAPAKKVIQAQASVIVEGEEATGGEPGEASADAQLSGGPLDLSQLGEVEEPPARSSPGFDRSASGWGIREHRLRPAPSGTPQPPDRGDAPSIPRPPWPGRKQLHDWDFVKPHSYPELTRSVSLEAFSFIGADGDDEPVFAERVRANLYLLEAGVTFFNSLGGDRDDRTEMDLDARIPFVLGENHQLAILPGISFPIDSRRWRTTNTNVRLQGIYGFASEGFAFQVRAGVTQGERRAGLLLQRQRVTLPAALYGGLVAWRFVPAVQLRAEASGEISSDQGPDRITLLPGVNFFPLGDPRVSLGATAIIETTAPNLSFDDAAYGALINAGVGFL